MRLEGKSIIVTGSTTGIGEAIARQCIAEGGKVLVHGRDRQRGETLVESLAPDAALHLDDLTDCEAPQRIVDAALSAFGRIDGVVNNAAWSARANLETSDAALFDSVVAINLRAPMLLIRAAAQQLRQTRGCVVNIGSVNGYSGEENLLVYAMTKGGLTTMTRNLADALLDDQIRVVQLTLGWVLTENEYKLQIAEGRSADWPDDAPRDLVPTGTMTRPEDVARVAAFWLSDASRPFSGGVFELEQYPWFGRHPKIELEG
ncbi:MAG: SDR family oxidoreductase [Pirellulales bacterium]